MNMLRNVDISRLTHLFPMHPFSTPCFKGVEKGCIEKEWIKLLQRIINKKPLNSYVYALIFNNSLNLEHYIERDEKNKPFVFILMKTQPLK